MTLTELENTLPNGLHDAELHSLSVDYLRRQLTVAVDVFVGDLDAEPGKREAYRKARIEISGLQFLVLEPPDPKYPFNSHNASRIDTFDMRKNLDPELVASLSDGIFLASLWVNNWNAFAHFAGAGAELVWLDDAITYRRRREHYLPGETIESQ